jgi:hypothetical protein
MLPYQLDHLSVMSQYQSCCFRCRIPCVMKKKKLGQKLFLPILHFQYDYIIISYFMVSSFAFTGVPNTGNPSIIILLDSDPLIELQSRKYVQYEI